MKEAKIGGNRSCCRKGGSHFLPVIVANSILPFFHSSLLPPRDCTKGQYGPAPMANFQRLARPAILPHVFMPVRIRANHCERRLPSDFMAKSAGFGTGISPSKHFHSNHENANESITCLPNWTLAAGGRRRAVARRDTRSCLFATNRRQKTQHPRHHG